MFDFLTDPPRYDQDRRVALHRHGEAALGELHASGSALWARTESFQKELREHVGATRRAGQLSQEAARTAQMWTEQIQDLAWDPARSDDDVAALVEEHPWLSGLSGLRAEAQALLRRLPQGVQAKDWTQVIREKRAWERSVQRLSEVIERGREREPGWTLELMAGGVPGGQRGAAEWTKELISAAEGLELAGALSGINRRSRLQDCELATLRSGAPVRDAPDSTHVRALLWAVICWRLGPALRAALDLNRQGRERAADISASWAKRADAASLRGLRQVAATRLWPEDYEAIQAQELGMPVRQAHWSDVARLLRRDGALSPERQLICDLMRGLPGSLEAALDSAQPRLQREARTTLPPHLQGGLSANPLRRRNSWNTDFSRLEAAIQWLGRAPSGTWPRLLTRFAWDVHALEIAQKEAEEARKDAPLDSTAA